MVTIYEVGGCVRDSLLNIPTKDIDFVAIAKSYEEMKQYLLDQKFKIHLEKPKFVTIRAGIPNDHPLRARAKDADFVLARKDSPTSDGRRPDYVEPGTLEEDLARRDATINAMAKDPFTGEIIDLFGGKKDLENRVWRFVGDPMTRIKEDGLRVVRALRFVITKELTFVPDSYNAIISAEASEMLQKVSVERIKDELEKMFIYNTVSSLNLIAELPRHLRNSILPPSIRLLPSLRKF